MNEYLAVYQPPIVLSARINATAEKGQSDITFTALTGSYSAVKDGMDIWIGTEYNTKDIGRLRIKSIADGTVTLAEHDLTLVSGTYLTAKSIFGLWSVFPTIEYEDDEIVEYKDTDIAYSDDNTNQGIIPIAGSHTAVFAGESVYFDASGSFSLVGNALTYSWDFGDASGTSSDETPGNYVYSTPGYYTVELTITDSAGKEQKTYRYVSVLARNSLPYGTFIRDDISGMRLAGGWRTMITLRDSTVAINDNDVVVIFTDDDTLPDSNQSNRAKTLFVGYIVEDTILHDWEDAMVSFEVGSASYILNKQETFGISVVSSASGTASQWYQMDDLTIKRGFWEFMKWNTTILNSVDVQMNFDDVRTQYFDTEKTYAWDSIRATAESTFYGFPCCDRLNTIWIENKPDRIGTDADSLDSNLSITKEDWIGMPEINQAQINVVSYLEAGGMIFTGGDETELHLAGAPGDVPNPFGTPESIGGLSVNSLSELLSITANAFGYMNRQYRSVDFTMAQQQWQVDLVPIRKIPVTVGASDTNRGITWSEKLFHADNIDIRKQMDSFRSVFELELSEFAYGTESEEIILPVPTIPAIPDIPITPISGSFWQPTYPIIPGDPTPNPGPYIFLIPDIDQPGCVGDINYPGNGPFNTGIAGTYSSNDAFFPYVGCSPASFYIRTAAHVSPTKYILHAKFEKWNSLTNSYDETDEDDFYSVVLYQNGQIIDVGNKQSFDDMQFREGTFEGDGSQWADGIGLLLNYDIPYVSGVSVTLDSGWTSGTFSRSIFGDKLSYSYISTMLMTGGAINSSEARFYSVGGGLSQVVNYDWSVNTDETQINRGTLGISAFAATVYTTGEVYYNGTITAPLNVRLTGQVPASVSNNLYFGIKGFTGDEPLVRQKIYIWSNAEYRIHVYSLNLYNVCVRTRALYF